MSTSSINPNKLFGIGTWAQIEDTFLLACGSTYAAGTSGGKATHKLSIDEIPTHSHTQLGVCGKSASSSPVRLAVQNDGNLVLYDANNTPLFNTKTSNSYEKTPYRAADINVDGATGSSGGSKAHNNMPPYLAVYVWRRLS